MIRHFKIRTLLIFGTTIVLASTLFHVSQRVQSLEDQRADLQNKTKETAYDMHILRAEWAHLTSPQNLQHLVDTYLDLGIPTADALMSRADMHAAITPPPATDAYNEGLMHPVSTRIMRHD